MESHEWKRRNHNGALTVAINAAVEALPNDEGPEPEYSSLSWREIGQLLYGFDDAAVAQAYERRLQLLIERSSPGVPGSKATRERRITTPFFDRLADAFASLKPRASSGTVAVAEASSFNALYVPRPELHQTFHQLVEAGARVIVLVGQAGMGKTWLAREVTRASNGAEAPFVRFHEGVPHKADVQSLAAVVGYEGILSSEPVAHLAISLCSANASPVVVLDNFDSADELVDVLPSMRRSLIVATCRTKGDKKPAEFAFVDVERMSLSEATRLARMIAPSITEDESHSVAKALGCHALALSSTCVLIREGGLRVSALVGDYGVQNAEAVGRLHTTSGISLRAVYQRMLEMLETRDWLAVEIAADAAFSSAIGGVGPPVEGHFVGWPDKVRLRYRGSAPNRPEWVSRLRWQQAAAVLRDYRLVEVTWRGMPLFHYASAYRSDLERSLVLGRKELVPRWQ